MQYLEDGKSKKEEKKSHKIKSRQKEKLKARQIVILKHIARYQIDIKICRKREREKNKKWLLLQAEINCASSSS